MHRLLQISRDWRATGSLREALELARLARLPRYVHTRARVLGTELALVDSASFAFMYREIFCRELYRFASRRPDPVIVDVGANIGLSVLYFKRLYPRARVLAFEADPVVFRVLQRNVGRLEGVELDGRAAWTDDGSITFHSEGADAGRIRPVDGTAPIRVACTRLRDHLADEIDLLKIDIEGAEVDVLADCADRLGGVERVFVEYHSLVGEPQRLAQLLAVLRDAGLRVWVEAPVRAEHPFLDRPREIGMDLQLNVFATR